MGEAGGSSGKFVEQGALAIDRRAWNVYIEIQT